MTKVKRKKERAKKQDLPDAVSDDDSPENPDPKSREYWYDEVDEFHEQHDKLLLEKTQKLGRKEGSDDDEEVLGFSSSDESDYSDIGGHKMELAELDSDIEGNEELEETHDVQAWGKSKHLFIGGQDVDQAYSEYHGEEDEMAAMMEEEEALAIQKRMTEQLDDEDYGLELFKPTQIENLKVDEKDAEKIQTDLSKLTRREKLRLLQKESPEFLDLVGDFRLKMAEIKEYLQQLRDRVQDGTIPPGAGADYIKTKYDLILHYCTNISFYLVLKARRTPIQSHPIIKRLLQYRSLLSQLEPVDELMAPQIQAVLNKLSRGEPVQTSKPPADEDRVKKKLNRAGKKLQLLSKEQRKAAATMDGDHDSSEAVQLEDNQGAEGEAVDETADLDPDGKRSITYQMAKNKGLIPYRKKENRNPRVKLKRKYRDALKKRRSQLREPTKEHERYGGEKSGIKAWQRKSVKLN